MDIAFRLAVAGFVIVAPSLLFVGLWRGLHALRDDRLIERLTDDATGRPLVRPHDLVPAPNPDAELDVDVVSCNRCGAANLDGMTFCQDCLSRLPD